MNNLEKQINKTFENKIIKITLSNLVNKDYKYHKIKIDYTNEFYLVTKFTKTQVFHENITDIIAYINKQMNNYKQLNAWDEGYEYSIKISKKGKVMYSKNKHNKSIATKNHNRKKQYILQEGTLIKPLIDMGVFTKDGKIVNSMYDKYRQINRFIEIINDSIKDEYQSLNIIDFGCGKSYLTFILYYFLTEIKKTDTKIIGLDLKESVINECNTLSKKYNYDGLSFKVGSIEEYENEFPVDMVITLHACDTATDYALFNAIKWNAKMIFSVPCCQHELNTQIKSDEFSIITRYGIAKERISALYTDIIRCNLLEVMSYKVQLLEFIDITHTPKNLLIRAELTHIPDHIKTKLLKEVNNLNKEFNLSPKLYNILNENNLLN